MSDVERIDDLKKRLEEAYDQLSQNASRLIVVHRAGEIMSATHDQREIGKELLAIITDALLSGSGAMAVMRGDEMEILVTHGLDVDQEDRIETSSTEGSLWSIASSRDEALLVDDPESDPELLELVQALEEGGEIFEPVFRVYVPMYIEGQLIGILAVGPRVTGAEFTPEDLRFLETLSSHAAVALHHSLLFQEKERRIEELSVLLRISREITSTLDLDQVLTTIVTLIGSVIPNDRCLIALYRGEKLEIRAISGEKKIDREQVDVYPVNRPLQWVGYSSQEVALSLSELTGEEGEEAGEEQPGADVFREYFSGSEFKSVLAMPLTDDQGTLGVLALESRKDEEFPWEAKELAQILANQTAIAIRNAELYSRIPRLGVFQPMMARAGKVGRWWKKRGVRILAYVLPILLLYFFLPLPARLGGDATVVPHERMVLRAAKEGILRQVFFEEGAEVDAGVVLATLENDESMTSLQTSQADLESAEREAEQARVRQDAFTYRIKSMEAEKLKEEVRFRRDEIGRLDVRAPFRGVVLTPDLKERVGDYLDRGVPLVSIARLDRMRVEIDVSEKELGALEKGQKVSFKTYAYPGRSFRGVVWKIGYLPRKSGGEVTYRVTALVDNSDLALRPGMTGRTRIDVGWRPLRWILGRGTEQSFRLKFWF